ncbi:LrgB family protein [Sutcliffiella horikoshii]|uniref:LrgB family protein n=1 Tax=Sutcliffiella horikoshii TaxID=79883 RepID=UPI00203E8AA9|nr:LrgB family protein [Sutcliffiella horikoshii]MCM3619513.1 LrgB family protein [Sutcliffiella horikoshii]
MSLWISILFIFTTFVIFLGMRQLYQLVRSPLLNPVATTTLLLILLLVFSNVSYDTYMLGGWWIQELLGPAVVALAYPLYYQRKKIYIYRFPLFAGLFSGIMMGIISGLLYVKVAALSPAYSATFLPKSVTSPIAMDIAAITGGIPSLAAALVILSGIIGALIGPVLMKYFKISHYLGVGVALGCAAHGIGTAKAMEYGEEEAAFSSISMTISALVYALVLPFCIHYFL